MGMFVSIPVRGQGIKTIYPKMGDSRCRDVSIPVRGQGIKTANASVKLPQLTLGFPSP